MKTMKFGNLGKLVAILIVAIVIVLTVGVAVGGINENPTDENTKGDQNENENNGSNTEDENEENKKNEILIPQYVNYLTGLETDEITYSQKPYALVLSSSAPLYAVSSADLLIEIPCENGETRFLAYLYNEEALGKIGSVEPTRNYISALASAFGGIVTAYGKDDKINYSGYSNSFYLDLSKSEEYYYSEGAKYLYTVGKSVSKLSKEENVDISAVRKPNLPYSFAEFGSAVTCINDAEQILIKYENNATSFNYDYESQKYLLSKGAGTKTDRLNGAEIGFSNLFILFADTTTYEKSAGVEMVTETLSQGMGYYATGGTRCEIRWKSNEKGELTFEDLNGEKLIVNRGNSYIGYYKSSLPEGVEFN